MRAVAASAGVALDTVYAAAGPKPVLFRLLLETAISGTDRAVPALERDYVRAMQAEPGPEYYLLLVGQRGWDPDRFRRWLADAWRRLLLEDPGQGDR